MRLIRWPGGTNRVLYGPVESFPMSKCNPLTMSSRAIAAATPVAHGDSKTFLFCFNEVPRVVNKIAS